jgi:hypothetical protein
MDLTDEQWEILEPLIPQPPRREDGPADPGETLAMFSTPSSGYFAPVLPGRISPNATHPTRPATVACRNGSSKEFSAPCSKRWPKTSKNAGR